MQASATNLFTRVLPLNERKYIQMRWMNCEEYLRLPRRFLGQLCAFCETRGCLLLGRRRLKEILLQIQSLRMFTFNAEGEFFLKFVCLITRESN